MVKQSELRNFAACKENHWDKFALRDGCHGKAKRTVRTVQDEPFSVGADFEKVRFTHGRRNDEISKVELAMRNSAV